MPHLHDGRGYGTACWGCFSRSCGQGPSAMSRTLAPSPLQLPSSRQPPAWASWCRWVRLVASRTSLLSSSLTHCWNQTQQGVCYTAEWRSKKRRKEKILIRKVKSEETTSDELSVSYAFHSTDVMDFTNQETRGFTKMNMKGQISNEWLEIEQDSIGRNAGLSHERRHSFTHVTLTAQ